MSVDSVTVCELCLLVHRPWLEYVIYLDLPILVPLLSLQWGLRTYCSGGFPEPDWYCGNGLEGCTLTIPTTGRLDSLSLIGPLGFAQSVASLWGIILTPMGWCPHVCRDVRFLVAVLSWTTLVLRPHFYLGSTEVFMEIWKMHLEMVGWAFTKSCMEIAVLKMQQQTLEFVFFSSDIERFMRQSR